MHTEVTSKIYPLKESMYSWVTTNKTIPTEFWCTPKNVYTLNRCSTFIYTYCQGRKQQRNHDSTLGTERYKDLWPCRSTILRYRGYTCRNQQYLDPAVQPHITRAVLRCPSCHILSKRQVQQNNSRVLLSVLSHYVKVVVIQLNPSICRPDASTRWLYPITSRCQN